jgi:hypothetical protein
MALEHDRGTGEARRRMQGRQGGREHARRQAVSTLPSEEDIMLFRNRTLIVAASALALSASAAMAQTSPAKTPTPQQKRMAECSTANKGKHGNEYKSSMSTCLKGEKRSSTLTPQQQKMKDCNVEAGKQALSGNQRKSFMSTCLKGSS